MTRRSFRLLLRALKPKRRTKQTLMIDFSAWDTPNNPGAQSLRCSNDPHNHYAVLDDPKGTP